MNLVIDIGNTKVKLAVFESDTLIISQSVNENTTIVSIDKLLNKYPINACILSSVKEKQSEIIQRLSQISSFIQLDHTTPIPFINLYGTPETLGIDRIALVAAAVDQYPNQNVLIVDAGTCITYDFINKNKEYLGGRISPGLEMRYKSLNEFTELLPKLSVSGESKFIGDDTYSSIFSGVEQGVLSEVNTIIDDLKKENDDLFVILTGGDTFFFEKELKNSIFADQNLVLKGLNEILKYNA